MPGPRRAGLALALVAFLNWGHPGRAGAQMRGAYLPLDHPAHPVAELLVARGALTGLDGANRPFLLDDLRAAVARALAGDSEPAPSSDGARVRWLSGVLGSAPEEGAWTLSIAPEAGLMASTSDVPELLLAEGDSAAAPLLRLRAGAELGPLSVQIEPRRVIRGRTFFGSALARLSWSLGGLEWGDLERNWGPAGVTGLLISPLGGTRPEFSFFLGPDVLRFEYRTAPLSNGIDSDTGEAAARIWAMHRLRWKPSDVLEVALWETTLSVEPGGPDAARASPFRPFWFPFQQGRNDERNTVLGLDMAWRAFRSVRIEGQLFVDDYYRDRSTYPQRYGYTLQFRGPLSAAGGSWRAYGTAFTGWALTTSREEEYVVNNGRGMGRLRPDHREAGVFTTYAWGLASSSSGGTAELGLRWRRQGIASFTDPVRQFDPDRGSRYPSFSPEIEREVWALVVDLNLMAGPLSLRNETHLQYRRFPDAGLGWEWGLESTVELVWRIGRWHRAGPLTPAP